MSVLLRPVCAPHGLAGVLLLLSACASSPAPVTTTGAEPHGDQIAEGKALYTNHCAQCHGQGGEGSAKAPPLVGPSALPREPPDHAMKRKSTFRTAADVFGWVRMNMPADAPGSLTDQQYAAILAFDLHANGVSLRGPLDAESAPNIVLHP